MMVGSTSLSKGPLSLRGHVPKATSVLERYSDSMARSFSKEIDGSEAKRRQRHGYRTRQADMPKRSDGGAEDL